MDCRSFSKIPGLSRIVSAEMAILAAKSKSESAGVLYTMSFTTTEKKNQEEINQVILKAMRRDHNSQSIYVLTTGILNRYCEGSMSRQVLMHMSDHLMIWYATRW
ncbi:hypothetical protein AVEN_36499-1 [Araneus ventricosus]|uniref:Uncharacterized protein n=1 Tax=Araneus ventricosus TaxID=182803 RepID=A0A4Y2S2K6_ARAVE|nr:hypothetical protein AVEN_19118-1 [Araneus ventricosus]GBN82197.1 hypothetical protein AVEN_36499-1 [Araneus ventricosus]